MLSELRRLSASDSFVKKLHRPYSLRRRVRLDPPPRTTPRKIRGRAERRGPDGPARSTMSLLLDRGALDLVLDPDIANIANDFRVTQMIVLSAPREAAGNAFESAFLPECYAILLAPRADERR
jgi:hypothetical protein